MAGKTAPQKAQKRTAPTGDVSKAIAPQIRGGFKVPVPTAADTAPRKAGKGTGGHRAAKPNKVTKRNTYSTFILGAANAADVAYRTLDLRWTVQRGEANDDGLCWALSLLNPESGERVHVGHFATSDLALNFAARTDGATDKELDVTGGRSA